MPFPPVWPQPNQSLELWFRAACRGAFEPGAGAFPGNLPESVRGSFEAEKVFDDVAMSAPDESALVSQLAADLRWKTIVAETATECAKHKLPFAKYCSPDNLKKYADNVKKAGEWLKGTKTAASVTAAAAGAVLTVGIAYKIPQNGVTIPVALQADAKKAAIPVTFLPSLQSNNIPIPVTFQWQPPSGAIQPIQMPFQFSTPDGKPISFQLSGNPTLQLKGPTPSGGIGDQLEAINQRLDHLSDRSGEIQKQLDESNQRIMGVTTDLRDTRSAVEGLHASLQGTQDSLRGQLTGIDQSLKTYRSVSAARGETISVAVPQNATRTVELNTVDAEGVLHRCAVNIRTQKIGRSSVELAVDGDSCGRQNAGAILASRALAVGTTVRLDGPPWALTVDSVDAPWFQTRYVHLRLTSS